MIGVLIIAMVLIVVIFWAWIAYVIRVNRRASTRTMAARDMPQYGLRDNRTGEVEIKRTQAAAGNDPRWMYGPYSTVMRMVDANGNPVPDKRGQWQIDFFPDP
jgi:uncharacterized membrane protein YdbT with pleckstrin-like domain